MSIIDTMFLVAFAGLVGGLMFLLVDQYEHWTWNCRIVAIPMIVIGSVALVLAPTLAIRNRVINSVELTGTVSEINAAQYHGYTEWLAEIETEAGETYTVTLGAGSRSKYQSLSDFVLEGDTVTGFVTPVIGREAIYDGDIRSISRD